MVRGCKPEPTEKALVIEGFLAFGGDNAVLRYGSSFEVKRSFVLLVLFVYRCGAMGNALIEACISNAASEFSKLRQIRRGFLFRGARDHKTDKRTNE